MINLTISRNTKKAMDLLKIKSYPFTEKELKNNFRNLAKKYHSDVGGSDSKMKKINEAHSILKNLAKQETSEHQKDNFKKKQNEKKETDMFAVFDPCSDCSGTGIIISSLFTGYKECHNCSGTGIFRKTLRCNRCNNGKFTLKNGKIVDCLTCKGTGIFREIIARCRLCGGSGKGDSIYEKIEAYCPNCDGTGEIELKLYNPVIPKGAIL